MDKDQTLLQEAYDEVRLPSYWHDWLSAFKHEIHEDKSVSVDDDVDLSNHDFATLPFVFRYVSGNFTCSFNPKLVSLEGSPRTTGGRFVCSDNLLLPSLKGGPEEVGKSFGCSRNPELTTLEGAPRMVGGHFYCHNNHNLVTLEGGPRAVNGTFSCSNCEKLVSLRGLPRATAYAMVFPQAEIQAELKRQYLEKFSDSAKEAFGDVLWDL